MKKLLGLLLVLALLASGVAAIAEENIPGHPGTGEGPGWKSPEAAVLAYIDGLNRGSVDDMLATFAVETLVEHMDTVAYVERLRAFNPTMTLGVPVTGDYSRSLLANARRGDLARSLMNQYIEMSAHLNGYTFEAKSQEDRDALFARFAESPAGRWPGAVEFVGWVNPVAVTEGKLAYPQNLFNAAYIAECYGVDDMTWMIAHLRLDGVDALLFMNCACYDGKWYNLEFGGIPAIIVGLDMAHQALAYASGEDSVLAEEEIRALLSAFPDPRGSALLSAAANSELAGSRWALTGLSDSGIAVAESEEAALTDGGAALWGELRLYRIAGGLIRLRVSPALQAQLGMDGQRARILLAWTSGAGRMTLIDARAREIELDLEELKLSQSGDTLTFALPNGLTATFERVA